MLRQTEKKKKKKEGCTATEVEQSTRVCARTRRHHPCPLDPVSLDIISLHPPPQPPHSREFVHLPYTKQPYITRGHLLMVLSVAVAPCIAPLASAVAWFAASSCDQRVASEAQMKGLASLRHHLAASALC